MLCKKIYYDCIKKCLVRPPNETGHHYLGHQMKRATIVRSPNKSGHYYLGHQMKRATTI